MIVCGLAPYMIRPESDDVSLPLTRAAVLLHCTAAGVWTNTCCSHPLYGQDPNEIDSDDDIATGAVPGAKAAAVRKLAHELGGRRAGGVGSWDAPLRKAF